MLPKEIKMTDKDIPFQTIDWMSVPKTEHLGVTGKAYWRTMQFEDTSNIRKIMKQTIGVKKVT